MLLAALRKITKNHSQYCRCSGRDLKDHLLHACQKFHRLSQSPQLKCNELMAETAMKIYVINTIILNLIQEEIKRRLNSGNAGYHSVQNLLSSRLLSKNIQIRIYKTIILPVVLYGCETWLWHWGRNIDWGCLRTGCRREYLDRREIIWHEIWENYIMKSFITCTLLQA
jgi:hypothetical protein